MNDGRLSETLRDYARSLRSLSPRRPPPGAPIGDDSASRLLGWLSALMSFLAALALAGAMAVSDMADRWTAGLAGGLTVQVAASGVGSGPAPGGTGDADPQRRQRDRAEKALEITRATPGVRRADVMDDESVSRLLEPWLGPGAAADPLLPVPSLIEAQVAGPVDVAGLRRRLDAAGLAASVDDHAVWLSDLSAFAGAATAAALGVAALIFGSGLAAVAFAVRAGLAINHDVVRLLHLMGAPDDYISRQFETHIGRRTLRGGAVGAAAAAAALLGLDQLAGGLRATLLPTLDFSFWQWAALLLTPPAMALPAVAVARRTVRRGLERMP